MTTSTDSPKVYAACLASYNSGILHGRWINIDQSKEGIQEEIEEMLAQSPVEGAEEWAFHDSELFGIQISEWESLESLEMIGELFTDCPVDRELAAEVYNTLNWDGRDVKQYLEDNYQGSFDSVEDYARQWLEDTGSLDKVPEPLKAYFDYEAYARDIELEGSIDIYRMGGECHIFYRF